MIEGRRVRKRRRLRALTSWVRSVLRSAIAWFCVFICAGVALTLAGLYLLAGLGWTLVGGGLVLLGGAWFLRLGITTHV